MASNGESGNGRSSSGKIASLRPHKIGQTNTNSRDTANVKCEISFEIVKGN